MRFLGSKSTQNALAAANGAFPRPLADFKGALRNRGKGKEGKEGGGKGERGIREGKEGGKGREEGRERKGKEEGKGGEGEFASLALGGIDAPE